MEEEGKCLPACLPSSLLSEPSLSLLLASDCIVSPYEHNKTWTTMTVRLRASMTSVALLVTTTSSVPQIQRGGRHWVRLGGFDNISSGR